MENSAYETQTKSTRTLPFGRLFTWQMARRTLMGLAGLATLIAIFYTVENWRGKRAWENCKRELEAKGAVLAWNAYIPPVVPADQNFFDAPKMADWFIRPPTGRPTTNESRQRLDLFNTNTTLEISDEGAARDYLAWSDQSEPNFDAIREALKRPYSRMNGDYSLAFATMPIPDFITVRTVTQVLSQRAKCALLIGEPERALRELTLMHDLCRLLEGKPTTLVAAMINVAVTGLYVDTIANGIRLEAWREPQLATIQEQLQQINLLPIVRSAFECERVAVCHILETMSPKELSKLFSNGKTKNLWERLQDQKFLILTVAPRGWIYQNMVTDAEAMDKAIDGIDSTNQFVLRINQAEAALALEGVVSHVSPYTFLASVAIPNHIRATQVLVRNQTMVNQAFTVCALERYRLAHEKFPETLDALVPDFVKEIPHDIIGGQPLKYRRTDDGKFLLYSIGWNEKDDGGTPGKTLTDNEHGDWVWPIPVK